MTIINATAHPIVVGEVTIPPSGVVIRAIPTEVPDGDVGGVPCFRTSFGAPVGVPECIGDDEIFIVSSIAQSAIRAHRPDIAHKFFVPHGVVRDENGAVIGAKGIARPTEVS